MEKIAGLLNSIVIFISNNPPVVFIVFLLSLFANLIQIGTYFRDKRRIGSQIAEQKRLSTLVETYEDVLQLARERVQDKESLESLKAEILEKEEFASNLSEKIKILERSAQRSLVKQAIDYNLDVLKKSHNEIKRLQNQYTELEGLPDIPEEHKYSIEEQVKIALKKPYELPPEFLFKSVLLVLFMLLLPYPVDTLLIPFLLLFFLEAFFEAAALFPSDRVKNIIRRHFSLLIFLATLGVWKSFFGAVGYVGRSLTVELWAAVARFYEVLLWPVTMIFAFVDWRRIKGIIKEIYVPKLDTERENRY